MIKMLSITDIYAKKYQTLDLPAPFEKVLGQPERGGIWLIKGKEKNGKTWLAVLLAKMLATIDKVLYVSAEEGLNKDFRAVCKRADLSHTVKKIHFLDYTEIPDLITVLNRKQSPRVVILDNLTVYNVDLKKYGLKKLYDAYPDTTFIMLAHIERNEPFGATARDAQRYAKLIFNVQGLAATVSGRCPGGTLIIDEEKAALYHGQHILTQ